MSRPVLPWPSMAGVFALCLVVYGRTLYPTVPGGDAGELVATAAGLGVVHPPGYPLWTLLAWFFSRIPVGAVAWRVAWLSALCNAAAAALVYATVSAWSASRGPGPSTGDGGSEPPVADARRRAGTAGGLVAAGLFAFSPTVWAWSVGAEVFPLNNFFAALLLLLALRWQESREPTLAVAIAFVVGLGLANHHTLVFLAAPLALWLLVTGRAVLWTPRRFAALAGAGLLGLTPYAWLVIAGSSTNPLSWGDTSTWQGFVDHLLRRDYGTFQLLPEGHAASASYAVKLACYAGHFASASLWVGPLLVLVVAIVALRSSRPKAEPAAASWIGLVTAFVVLYLGVFLHLANVAVGDPLLLDVLSRFWMQADLALCVLAGAGFAAIAAKLPPRARHVAPLVAAALVFARLAASADARADRGGGVVEAYGRAIVDPLPRGSLLLTEGDLITNVVRYLQSSESIRGDIVVLDQELLTRAWYVKRMASRYPEIRFPGAVYHPGVPGGFSMKDFLDANHEGRRVWVYPEWKKGDTSTEGFYRTWPAGLASEVLPSSATRDFSKWALDSSTDVAALEARGWAPMSRYAPGTWERVALEDVWQARHRRAVFLLAEAIARNNDRGLLTVARGEFEAAARSHPSPPAYLFKNLGIACERLARTQPALRSAELAAWRRFLELAPADDPDREAIAAQVKLLESTTGEDSPTK